MGRRRRRRRRRMGRRRGRRGKRTCGFAHCSAKVYLISYSSYTRLGCVINIRTQKNKT